MKLSLRGQGLKIGWEMPSPVPSEVVFAVQQIDASWNAYLGGLDENATEEWLMDNFSRYGLIDWVGIGRDLFISAASQLL